VNQKGAAPLDAAPFFVSSTMHAEERARAAEEDLDALTQGSGAEHGGGRARAAAKGEQLPHTLPAHARNGKADDTLNA